MTLPTALGVTWGEAAGIGGLVVSLIGIAVAAWNTRQGMAQQHETGLLGITMDSSKEIIADLRIEVDRCNAKYERLRERLTSERVRFRKELAEQVALSAAREATLETEIAGLQAQVAVLDERILRHEAQLGAVARRDDPETFDPRQRRRADDGE